MKVKLVVDSTADLSQSSALRIRTVPLTVTFGTEEYLSGMELDAHRFYRMLAESDVLPTTSQPTPYAFAEAYEESLKEADQVVCITCSGRLSGTYQSAVIAAEDFSGKVHVVDSGTVAIGLGVLVEYALELVDRGCDAEEITWKLLQKRDRVRLMAMVDTLEYLKKGGRLSAAAAFAGELLNIKPIIFVVDGQIRVIGKARGAKQGGAMMVQRMTGEQGVDWRRGVMLGYTGISEGPLDKFVKEHPQLWEGRGEIPRSVVGSVVGTHVGPGAVAVAYFADEL